MTHEEAHGEVACKKCGTIDYVSIVKNGPHFSAYCLHCESFIDHVSMPKDDWVFPFGKHKNKSIRTLSQTTEGREYIRWCLDNNIFKSKSVKELAENLNET